MKINDNGIIREMTKKELQENEDSILVFETELQKKEYSPLEVLSIFLKKIINEVEIPNEDSLKMKSYYPCFEDLIGKTLPVGFKFVYNNELWKVRQEHIIQAQYAPSIETASLYERIDEIHLGNKYDPIPYAPTLKIEEGKIYIYEGRLYKCIRGSENPLYDTPEKLIDIFFKKL